MLRNLFVVLSLTIIMVGKGLADEPEFMRNGVEFRKLSSTVWMHTSYKVFPNYGPFPANGLIIIENSGAILVDSGWTNADAKAVLDWAEQDLGIAVTTAYFTHAHIDKMGGMESIQGRGIATFATELTNKIAPHEELLPAEFTLSLTEIGHRQKVGPLEFYYPGPGHSVDNIVLNIDSVGIVFGGCLVRPPRSRSLGNIKDAVLGHWSKAIDNVAKAFPNSDIVIPTHGPPGGRELLELTSNLARESGN